MAPPLLRVDSLSVSYGGLKAVDSVSLEIPEGKIVGLIGPNGAGKTTFIDALTGFTPSSGDVTFEGESIAALAPHRRTRRGVSRTFQSLELFEDLTVRENLQSASSERRWWSVFADLFLPARRTGDDFQYAVDMLGLADVLEERPNQMSHGQRKLVTVARALVTRPKLLLLDEPAAGLSSDDSIEFGGELRKLQRSGMTIFLVDHDMGLVLSTCDYIYVLEFGKLIAEGTPADIRKDTRVINAYLGAHAAEQVQEVAAAETGGPSLHKSGEGGGIVTDEYAIQTENLSTGYAGVPVVRDLNLVVRPGEVVALLGPNGAGKTTTLLTLSGLVPVLGGTANVLGRPIPKGKAYLVPRRGMAHVSEDRSLFFQLTVKENIKLGMRGRRIALEKIFEYFPELEPLQNRRAGLLSGGEQQMLALGRALASDPKVMLVDEMSLGLAPIIVERLLPVLRRIADERGTALLLVEQQVHMALEVADRAYVLTHGNLMLEGDAKDLRGRRDLLESSYLGEVAL